MYAAGKKKIVRRSPGAVCYLQPLEYVASRPGGRRQGPPVRQPAIERSMKE